MTLTHRPQSIKMKTTYLLLILPFFILSFHLFCQSSFCHFISFVITVFCLCMSLSDVQFGRFSFWKTKEQNHRVKSGIACESCWQIDLRFVFHVVYVWKIPYGWWCLLSTFFCLYDTFYTSAFMTYKNK